MGEKSREPGAGEPGGSPGGAPKSRRSQSLILGGDRREEMFEAHADIAIGADAKVIADEILDTLDEPALKRMASCHGLKTQVPGMLSASGGRSTGGKERLKTILKGHRASCNCKHKDQLTLWKSAPLGQCTDPLLGEELDMQASWFKLVTKRLQSLSNGQKIHMPDSEHLPRAHRQEEAVPGCTATVC